MYGRRAAYRGKSRLLQRRSALEDGPALLKSEGNTLITSKSQLQLHGCSRATTKGKTCAAFAARFKGALELPLACKRHLLETEIGLTLQRASAEQVGVGRGLAPLYFLSCN